MPTSTIGNLAVFRPKIRRELPRQPLFHVRPDTSDAKAIQEVFDKNAYRRKAFQIDAGDRWLDMGCNVGAFSVLAGLLGCKVRSIEAERENSHMAAHNLGLNHLPCDVWHCAVVPDSYRDKNIGLHVNTEPLALRRHSITRARRRSSVVEVPARPFSSFLVDGFDCLKVNIEGAEIPILREVEDWSRVRKMVLEWSFDAEPRMAVLREVLDRLEAAFPSVMLSRSNLPWHLEAYPFFPPNVYIFCSRA